jgi:hypothetical protein
LSPLFNSGVIFAIFHTALTNLTDRWLKYMDDGNLIGTVFLDHRKAFDMVDHKLLCKKLQYYKISTSFINIIKSRDPK